LGGNQTTYNDVNVIGDFCSTTSRETYGRDFQPKYNDKIKEEKSEAVVMVLIKIIMVVTRMMMMRNDDDDKDDKER